MGRITKLLKWEIVSWLKQQPNTKEQKIDKAKAATAPIEIANKSAGIVDQGPK